MSVRLEITKVGTWIKGKYPDGDGNYHDVRRVLFKSFDVQDGKTYYLNLDKKHPEVVERWSSFIVVGNVLEVELIPKEEGTYVKNDTTVDKFKNFEFLSGTKQTN